MRADAQARSRRFTLDRTSLAAAGLGAATVAGYAPLYLYPLSVVTLALLVWLWNRAPDARRAAALGWWFGVGLFLTGVSWVYVSLHNFGAMPAPLAALATLLFCAFLALFPALVGYGYVRLPASAAVKLILWLPALWTLSEWIRGWIFTGFPWLAIGYSQVPSSPLAGYAPILGVYGLTLVTVCCAGLLVLPAERARTKHGSQAKVSAQGPTTVAVRVLARPAPLLLVLALGLAGYALKQVTWTSPYAGATLWTKRASRGENPKSSRGYRWKYRTRTLSTEVHRSVGTRRSAGPSASVVTTSTSTPTRCSAWQSRNTDTMGPP